MHTPRHAGRSRSGRRICRDKIEAAVTCPAYCQTPLLCKLCALLAIRHVPTSCRVATQRVGVGSAPSGIPIYFRWGILRSAATDAPPFPPFRCIRERGMVFRLARFLVSSLARLRFQYIPN